jgi:hypothetical protein
MARSGIRAQGFGRMVFRFDQVLVLGFGFDQVPGQHPLNPQTSNLNPQPSTLNLIQYLVNTPLIDRSHSPALEDLRADMFFACQHVK